LYGGWSGDQQLRILAIMVLTLADRLYGRPHQAGHEAASGIGREKRESIRRLVELGLKAKPKG
jgi:hypothetical protein